MGEVANQAKEPHSRTFYLETPSAQTCELSQIGIWYVYELRIIDRLSAGSRASMT